MTGADPRPFGEPSRSIEVELKFDADEDTPLPDWADVPGVTTVGEPEVRELDARYFDTDDLALGRAGYALRRRSGGPDAGWHVKGARIEGGRTELGWPLGVAVDEDVPAGVLEALAEVTDAEVVPIARILNTRVAYALTADDGAAVAEFVDDRVTATDLRDGRVRTWREWEIELIGPAAADTQAFFAAVEKAVLAAGGRPAASDSKLARALGL